MIRSPSLFAVACCVGLVGILSCSSQAVQAVENGTTALDPNGSRNFVVRVENGGTERCSGVLIAPDLALTAAHCVVGRASYTIVTLDRRFRAQQAVVADLVVHPDFVATETPRRQSGIDLALLRLARPLGAEYAPLNVGEAREIVGGQRAVVAGFGLDEQRSRALVLREAPLVRVEGLRFAPHTVAFIGANGIGKGTGACQGDSGGPLLDESGGHYALLGIVSWTSGTPDQPAEACGGLTAVTPLADQVGWVEGEAIRFRLRQLPTSEKHVLTKH